jgi:hypothetical protein
VQDFGGSQEYWVWEKSKLTLQAARILAAEMIDADTLAENGGQEELERKYGARAHELCSDNVCPGWNCIFIRRCSQDGDCDISNEIEECMKGGYACASLHGVQDEFGYDDVPLRDSVVGQHRGDDDIPFNGDEGH